MGRNKPEANFSDDSVNYKNGVSDYDTVLEQAKRQSMLEKQKQEDQIRHQETVAKIKNIKYHAIPFKDVCLEFKLSFILVAIACLGNIILSIIYKDIIWSNFFNFLAAFAIFDISRHFYLSKNDEVQEQVTEILKQNLCQVCSDFVKYKLSIFANSKINLITDIVTILAFVCFAVLPAQNFIYAFCVALCLLSAFILIGLRKFLTLKSHIQFLTKGIIAGIIIKAIFNVVMTHVIQIDYMNIALLFLFIGLKIWLSNDSNTQEDEEV